jgi:hypothetical protein
MVSDPKGYKLTSSQVGSVRLYEYAPCSSEAKW